MSEWKERRTKINGAEADPLSYPALRRQYPWVEVFRAGFIVLSDHDDPHMLLVYQRAEGALPRRRGLPKGRALRSDTTILDTAARELREETGIDVFGSATLLPAKFVIERPEISVRELVIYFVAVLESPHAITLDTAELDGYEWFDLRNSLRSVRPTSKPTTRLFAVLDDVDFSATAAK